MAALLCASLLTSSIFPGAAALTYYVSSSCGSDTNPGTSPASAWKTLHFAAVTVPAGGSLLLRMGDSWELDAPLVLDSWGSGTPNGSRLAAILGAYADDQDPSTTARPAVGRVEGAGVGPVIYCADCAGLVVDGLEVYGGEQGVLFGYGAPSPAWGGVTVSHCFFHDVRGVRSGGNPMAWGSGIGFNTTERTGR